MDAIFSVRGKTTLGDGLLSSDICWIIGLDSMFELKVFAAGGAGIQCAVRVENGQLDIEGRRVDVAPVEGDEERGLDAATGVQVAPAGDGAAGDVARNRQRARLVHRDFADEPRTWSTEDWRTYCEISTGVPLVDSNAEDGDGVASFTVNVWPPGQRGWTLRRGETCTFHVLMAREAGVIEIGGATAAGRASARISRVVGYCGSDSW